MLSRADVLALPLSHPAQQSQGEFGAIGIISQERASVWPTSYLSRRSRLSTSPCYASYPPSCPTLPPAYKYACRCHHAGHRAYACPSRPDSSSATDSPVPRNRRPPDACWSCGELHYSDGCAIQAQRKAIKECIICADEHHWMKACPRYNEVVKNPKPCPNNCLWCLRCATEGHSTSRCDTNGAPINFPQENADRYGCLWCGISGQNMQDCMRRLPSACADHVTNDQVGLQGRVTQLEADVKAVQKSETTLRDIQGKVVTMQRQVHDILTFQRETTPKLRQAESYRRKFHDFLSHEWTPMKKSFEEHLLAGCTENKREAEPLSQNTSNASDEDMAPSRLTGKRYRIPLSTPRKPFTPSCTNCTRCHSSCHWWSMYTNLQRPFHAIHLHNTPPWLYPQHQDQSCITATPCAPCPVKYSYFALQDKLTILPSSLTPNFAIMHYATHPSSTKVSINTSPSTSPKTHYPPKNAPRRTPPATYVPFCKR